MCQYYVHCRIHYPLALPYCGPPDPAVLQETIRQLRLELEKTKKQVQILFCRCSTLLMLIQLMDLLRVMLCLHFLSIRLSRDRIILHLQGYRESKLSIVFLNCCHLLHVSLSLSCIRYDALLQEKEELEEAFESFKQEMLLTQEGAASKEIRILKKVIKNLEVGKNRRKNDRWS